MISADDILFNSAYIYLGELYQGVKALETLKTVSSPALNKHENEQINLALKTLSKKAKTAIIKLEGKENCINKLIN